VTELSLKVGTAGAVTARHYAASSDGGPTLVLAHGAGADQRHRFMVTVASDLAAAGVQVVTFNFLYTEQRRRSPDRAPLLEETWRAVLEGVATNISPTGMLVVALLTAATAAGDVAKITFTLRRTRSAAA